MRYTVIIDAVVARLGQVVTACDVKRYPENLETYQLTDPKGEILVRFSGSSSEEGQQRMKKNSVGIQVQYLARNFFDEGGIDEVMEQGRLGLDMYMLPGIGKCELSAEHFLHYKNGVWQFGQDYTVHTLSLSGVR